MAIQKLTVDALADNTITTDAIANNSIDIAKLSNVNLTIAPEVLEIQVAAPDAGQATMWKWTWEQSTLPYARRTITNSGELNVPLYKEGTYVVNNFAAYDIFAQMTQTHSLYLKWVDGAGTDNLVSWATSAGPISDTHPDINGGNATDVQRITVNVPSTITPPSLTNPSVSYTVVNSGSGSYTFSGAAKGDNPNLGPFYRGGTYTVSINATGHPFYLTTDNGTNFAAGTYFGEYTSGVTGSRTDSGTITFTVPAGAPDTLYYQCGNHSAMRGEITVKDLAVETNINGNYVVYFQHTQEGHKTAVELRPIPSLVNQMCIVYDASSGQFVPQDLSTYVENTPSFENKIREVAGTAELVVEDGSAVIAKVNVYDDSTYLPLTGNNPGDQAFATDTDILYIWDGSAWQQAGAANSDDLTEGSTNLFFTDARADARIALQAGSNLDLSGKSTTDLAEGTNLYYTDARVGTYLSGNDYDTATNIVASITDSAPATLDTLNELAAALGDDPNFATTVSTNIGTKVSKAGDIINGQLTVHADTTAGPAMTIRNDNASAGGRGLLIQHDNGGAGTDRYALNIVTGYGISDIQSLYVDGNGNVGIGTDSPDAILDVRGGAASRPTFIHASGYGGIQIAGTGASSGAALIFSNNYTTSVSEEYSIHLDGATDDLVFISGDPADIATEERMRLTDDSATTLLIKAKKSTFSSAAQLDLVGTNANAYGGSQVVTSRIDSKTDGGPYESKMRFWTNNGSNVLEEHMTIDHDGNVGIGTDSPATPLQIYQSTNATAGDQKPTPVLTLSAHTNSDNEGPAIEFNSAWVNNSAYLASTINNGWGVAKIAGVYDDDQSNGGALSFYTNEGPSATSGATSTQLTEKMRIKPNGNVGIGTNSPQARIHAHDPAKTSYAGSALGNASIMTSGADGILQLLSVDDDSTWAHALTFKRYRNDTGATISGYGFSTFTNTGNQNANTFDRMGLHYGADEWPQNNAEIMTWKSNGRVGIGSSNPQVSLVVGGTDALQLPVGTSAQRPSGQNGYTRINTTNNVMEYYVNNTWSQIGIADGSSINSAAANANDLLDLGITTSGEYWIDLPSLGPTLVYCDMQIDGGGWMMLGYAGSTSGVGNSNHMIFHQFGTIATSRTYGQTSFSRFDQAWAMSGAGTSSWFMWKRTSDDNILVHTADEMYNRMPGGSSGGNMNFGGGTSVPYNITTMKMSNTGNTTLDIKSPTAGAGTRYENGPGYPGISWNSTYNSNSDSQGGYNSWLNRRALAYWETNGPESQSQWFHGSVLDMGDGTVNAVASTSRKDVEIYFRVRTP